MGTKPKPSHSRKTFEAAAVMLAMIIILTILGVILDLSGIDNVVCISPAL